MKVDQTEASGSPFLRGPKNRIFWNLFSGCFVSIFRIRGGGMKRPKSTNSAGGDEEAQKGHGSPKRVPTMQVGPN